MIATMIHRAMAIPFLYQASQAVAGATHAWRTVTREYIRPVPGMQILDLGCGPGSMYPYLSQCNYTGVDIAPEYISTAQKRYPNGTFHCSDVDNFSTGMGTYDVCIAMGLLHHIDDALARKFFALSYRALRTGGRIITVDGCFTEGQSSLARWILSNDRGKFVRTPDSYGALARSSFASPSLFVRNDLFLTPNTMLVMCAEKES